MWERNQEGCFITWDPHLVKNSRIQVWSSEYGQRAQPQDSFLSGDKDVTSPDILSNLEGMYLVGNLQSILCLLCVPRQHNYFHKWWLGKNTHLAALDHRRPLLKFNWRENSHDLCVQSYLCGNEQKLPVERALAQRESWALNSSVT
jgi:hypothetical protein